MNKQDLVAIILGASFKAAPKHSSAEAYAPTNIALCKYWGKRSLELNLPNTPSLSISLGAKGATCRLHCLGEAQDSFSVNGAPMALTSSLGQRLTAFLNLFRTQQPLHFQVDLEFNIPFAAGLASSACGFASLVLALNQLFAWNLSGRELSILARLGSGSACRSIFQGFVEWQLGELADGSDSYAKPLDITWPQLRIGLELLSKKEKPLSSSEAMLRTVQTSAFYPAWPKKVSDDLVLLKQALQQQDFSLLGATAESNALSMHALMLSAWPPILYALPETVVAMQKIWQLRRDGVAVYFTQDAGPNLKLLFLEEQQAVVSECFPEMEILAPFSG